MSVSEPTDEELVRCAVAGDSAAFEQIVIRHQHHLERVVARYVADPSDAHDVTQVVFQRAHAGLATFRGDASLKTWLHRIAVNVALNYLRASERGMQVELEDVDPGTTPFRTTRVVARGVARKLSEALDQLPDHQRIVVEMRLLKEMSFSDVATATGCSEDAAKMTYHRAMKRLREMIGDE